MIHTGVDVPSIRSRTLALKTRQTCPTVDTNGPSEHAVHRREGELLEGNREYRVQGYQLWTRPHSRRAITSGSQTTQRCSHRKETRVVTPSPFPTIRVQTCSTKAVRQEMVLKRGPRTRVRRLWLLHLSPDPIHASPSREPLSSTDRSIGAVHRKKTPNHLIRPRIPGAASS